MKTIKMPLMATAISTTLLATVNVSASENPFELKELASGYMQLAEKQSSKMQEGACGEGKCGAKMMPEGALEKTAEGSCAGNKPMPKMKQGKETPKTKAMEGKCGEGKCGSNM